MISSIKAICPNRATHRATRVTREGTFCPALWYCADHRAWRDGHENVPGTAARARQRAVGPEILAR